MLEVCRRCGAPYRPEPRMPALRLCDACVADWRSTIVDLISPDTNAVRGGMIALSYAHHPAGELEPRWAGWHWEGLGLLLPAEPDHPPVGRFPSLVYTSPPPLVAPIAFQVWEARLSLPRSPLALRATYYPRLRVGVTGLEDPRATRRQFDRLWAERELMTKVGPRRGPQAGYSWYAPEVRARVLAIWRRGKDAGRTEDQIRADLAADPALPEGIDRVHRDTIAGWLDAPEK